MKSTALGFVACGIVAGLLFLVLRDDASEPAPRPGEAARAAVPPAEAEPATAVKDSGSVPTRVETIASPDATLSRTYTGRVVDERRFPVEGATVEFHAADGLQETTTTDSGGRFSLAPVVAALTDRLSIRASSRAEGFAIRWFGKAADANVGTLVLRHASPLRVLVLRDGAPVADAAIVVDLGKYREPTFTLRTDASGRATIESVPDGIAWVRAEHELGKGRARVFLPEESSVEVTLAPTNTFDVRVVAAGTGTAIAGAKLTIDETFRIPSLTEADENFRVGDSVTRRALPELTTVTDADGRARFSNLDPAGSFTVSVAADGYARIPGPPPHSAPRLVASPSPQILELTPSARRDVRVPVVAGELPVPPAGVAVALRFAAGADFRETRVPPTGVTMGRGEFVIPAWEGGGALVATAGDAGSAAVWIQDDSTTAREATFVRPRTITVHVVDADGRAVAGARAGAYNQGNNRLGEALTAADGRAVLGDLLPGLVNVRVASPTDVGLGLEIGSVDVKSGDGSIECVLPAVATMILQVRIDGRAALPAVYRVSAGGGYAMFRGSPPPRIVDEFPERGELRIAVELADDEFGKPLVVGMNGSGDLSGRAEWMPVRGGVESVVPIELVRAARLDVVVARPKGTRVKIGLEKLDPTKNAFVRAASSVPDSISVPNGPGDTFRFGELEPGVYRAIDEISKTQSPQATVPAGGVASIDFAIGSTKRVTGKVLMPPGTDPMLVRVVVDGQGLARTTRWQPSETFPDGVYVAQDGAFEVQIPGDRDVVVRPWHPWLQPAESGGRFATIDGATGVTLKLVSGQEIVVPTAELTAPKFKYDIPRVGVWRGAIVGEPDHWLTAPLVDGALRFGGIEPGRTSFLVDVRYDFAPLEFSDVEVGIGTTALPAVPFHTGGAIRVRILTAEGFDPPRIYVHATRVGGATYTRSHNSNGEAEVVLRGLGAGEFRVTASRIGEGKKPLDRVVTCDGVSDVILELDLR